MSARNFPRVAPRTRPRLKKTPLVKLPQLKYGIYNADGELQRVEQIRDPRVRVCNEFNDVMSMAGYGSGSYALPLADDVKATPRRKAVAQ